MVNRIKHTPSYLSTATLARFWHAANANVAVTSGWYERTGGSAGVFSKSFAAQSGWTIGFAFTPTSASGGGIVLRLYDADGTQTFRVSLDGTTRQLIFGRSATTLVTSASVFALNTEYYVEIQTVIADAPSGVVILKVDGVTDATANVSNVDTRAGLANAAVVEFVVDNAKIKDIYVNDNSGGVDDTFWDPLVYATLAVQSNGTTDDWTPSASTNASNVDDATPDGDSTYNATSTNGHLDLFNMSDTGYAAGTVRGVEWVADLRRTEPSGTARVAPVYRIGSTNYVRSDIVPRLTYREESQGDRLSPATGSAWTLAELDAMQVGIKRTAS